MSLGLVSVSTWPPYSDCRTSWTVSLRTEVSRMFMGNVKGPPFSAQWLSAHAARRRSPGRRGHSPIARPEEQWWTQATSLFGIMHLRSCVVEAKMSFATLRKG